MKTSDTTIKSVFEEISNYATESSKHVYQFNVKMVEDYIAFNKKILELTPGFGYIVSLFPTKSKV